VLSHDWKIITLVIHSTKEQTMCLTKNAAQGITPQMNPGGCCNPGNPPMFPSSQDKARKLQNLAIGAAITAVYVVITILNRP